MINRLFIIFTIILVSIVYSFYQKKSLESQLSFKSENILTKLPLAKFKSLDGTEFDPHDLFKDRTNLVVVHFWGTWCAPCEAELPALLTFINGFKSRPDVKFLLVAVNDDSLKVQKHIKKFTLSNSSIIWLFDNNNVHRDVYGTTRVPETYVFSSDKVTLRKFLGPQEWMAPDFMQSFQQFIQISSSKL